MNRSVTVYIVLDAFRWDYVNEEDCPFLHQLCTEAVYGRKLVSSPGFTQRTAMFTGTYPDVSDVFSVFYYDPEGSPYGFLRRGRMMKSVKALYEGLIKVPSERFRRRVKWTLMERVIRPNAHMRSGYPFPADVPLDVLSLMNYSEDGERPLWHPGALEIETLFDKLHTGRVRTGYYMHPVAAGYGDRVVELAAQKRSGAEEFHIYQFTDSDSKIHACGPESNMVHGIVRNIDDNLRRLWELYREETDDLTMVISGDHGMTEVTDAVDVQAAVKRLAARHRLKQARDYLLFVDSTMARLWFFSDEARNVFGDLFSGEEFSGRGYRLDESRADRLRIPRPSQKWGELIWRTNLGVVIDPCYFHPRGSAPVHGMHGYDTEHEDMKGMLAVHNPGRYPAKQVEEVKLIDLCPTLCDIFGAEYPDANEGTSLLG